MNGYIETYIIIIKFNYKAGSSHYYSRKNNSLRTLWATYANHAGLTFLHENIEFWLFTPQNKRHQNKSRWRINLSLDHPLMYASHMAQMS